MSIESHLSELARRHQAIEKQLEEEKTHPSSDRLKITELKRKKLSIKDEMAKLKH